MLNLCVTPWDGSCFETCALNPHLERANVKLHWSGISLLPNNNKSTLLKNLHILQFVCFSDDMQQDSKYGTRSCKAKGRVTVLTQTNKHEHETFSLVIQLWLKQNKQTYIYIK